MKFLYIAGLLLVVSLHAALAADKPSLPAHDRQWVQQEVKYLITDDERSAFLRLENEADREKFIDHFWAIRNPNSNAPTNAAKEEHYQRFAYANAHFGDGGVHDGWRSDRGMVYITLGPPQLIEKHPETPELKPLEIWFYQNLSGALPVHFYVLFYKRSASEDYELYSPYGDRPQKLINSTNAINNDSVAVRLIQRDINDEAAHVALSLIPGEPVDLKDPSPSLQSDVLLNNIRNYRNLPEIREMLAARSSGESVTHRILLGQQLSDLVVLATRDAGNQSSIHYMLRLLEPEGLSFTEQGQERYFYASELEVKLFDSAHQLVLTHKQKVSDYLQKADVAKLRAECFGIEGRLATPPGKYTLSITVTDLSTRQSFHQERAIVVPSPNEGIGVSQIVFAAAVPPSSNTSVSEPFSFHGVRLHPVGADNAAVTRGTPLRAIFQIWEPHSSPAAIAGKTINVHYLIGNVSSQDRREEDQLVDRGTFTSEGNLLVGKDLRTDSLAPGFYRLVVRVTDLETKATAYQSLNFEVRDPARPAIATWTVDATPQPLP